MNKEKITEGLMRCVQSGDFCSECPYQNKTLCLDSLHEDVLALLKRQQEEIDDLTTALDNVSTMGREC